MVHGTIVARPAGAVWRPEPPEEESLAAVFDEDPDPDEADEEDDPGVPFGVLRARYGWVGAAGPGVALRFPVRTDLPLDFAGIELRLRSEGRYVRSALSRLGDRDRDLTLRPALVPSDLREELYVVTAFLPWAAVSRHPGELTLEAWLTEDEDPVEEELWPFVLPPAHARQYDGPLGAVAIAAASAGAPQAGRALAGLFRLDAVGLAVAERLIRPEVAEPVEAVADRLAEAVSPRAWARVHAFLASIASDAEFLEMLAALLGLGGRGDVRGADAKLAAHFATLGLAPGAGWEAIRAAYRRFARLHHPDRAHGRPEERDAHDKMKRLNAAYAALEEAFRRR